MRKARLAAALAFVASFACSTPPPSIPFDQLPAREAAAACSFAARCGSMTWAQSYTGIAGADCEPTVERFDAASNARIQLALSAGTLTYDGNQAAECYAFFDQLTCDGLAAGTPLACSEVFQGRVADGGACTFDAECGAISECIGASGATCGVCTHVPQLGESCAMTPCPEVLFCDDTQVCVSRVGAGSACNTTNSACATPASCIGATTGSTAGTCTVVDTASVACSRLVCPMGQLCTFDGHAASCRAPRTDGTCDPQAFGGSDCSSSTLCDAATMHCAPFPTLGQPCTTACAAPARCVAQMCRASISNGGSCTNDLDCLSAHCATGTCAALPLCTH
jgi:hypothetical protein